VGCNSSTKVLAEGLNQETFKQVTPVRAAILVLGPFGHRLQSSESLADQISYRSTSPYLASVAHDVVQLR
jgi:hypothetical protein